MSKITPIIPKDLIGKTIGITGYSGYIGQHLVHYLEKAGHEVFLIPRAGAETSNQLSRRVAAKWNTPLELASQLEVLDNLIIINLAGYFINNHTTKDLSRLIDANLDYPLKIFEALIKTQHKNIINVGSSWEYTETGIVQPINLYAHLKAANAKMLNWYAERHPICVTNLKLNDTFGGLDPRAKLMPILKESVKTGETANLRIAAQKLNLLYITDVIEGICEAVIENYKIKNHTSRTTFLLASETITLGALTKKINTELGIKLKVSFEDSSENRSGLRGIWLDAPNLENWHPRISLNDGILNYFGKNYAY